METSIFIKTHFGKSFPVSISPEETVASLKRKINKTDRSLGDYILVHRGDQIRKGKLSEMGIQTESTIKLQPVPPITVYVVYNGNAKEIEIPSTRGTNIASVKKLVQKAYPGDAAMQKYPPILKKSCGTVLNDNQSIKAAKINNEDKLTAEAGVAPPAPKKTAAVTPGAPLDDATKEDLLTSFVVDAESSNVEIVFSFDTTGSMYACLAEVRKQVSETVKRLIKDIDNIRIGIIAHGDFCDAHSTYVIETCDLCTDADKIVKFVNGVNRTGGGDAPEAYELALQVAKTFDWTEDSSKAFVVIGDCYPHPPSYTTEKINWHDELDDLIDLGVKVYGVRALNQSQAAPFYEELSARSGTVSINFQNFGLITEMFLAICYRESDPKQLATFQAEIEKEGKMNKELGVIFETLAQPNPEKKKKETTTESLRSNAPWFDISKDTATTPQYELKDGKWIQYKSNPTKSKASPRTRSHTTTAISTPSSSTAAKSPRKRRLSFSRKSSSSSSKSSSKATGTKCSVM